MLLSDAGMEEFKPYKSRFGHLHNELNKVQ